MHKGHFERHLNRMRSLYRMRHDELVSCLVPFRKWFSVRGTGTGLHLVLQCRKDYLIRERFERERDSAVSLPPAQPESLPVALPESLSAADASKVEHILAERALRAGVRVYCVSDFLLPRQEMCGLEDREAEPGPAVPVQNEKHVYPALLLGFGALSPDQIREGVKILSKAWNIPDDM